MILCEACLKNIPQPIIESALKMGVAIDICPPQICPCTCHTLAEGDLN